MNNRNARSGAIAGLAAVALAWQGHAHAEDASFDCSKASSPIEKAICGSDQLRSQDRRLDEKYRAVLAEMDEGRRQALVKDQRAWLKHRNQCCGVERTKPENPSGLAGELSWEYDLRLRDLEIARKPEAFTAAGWNDPIVLGDDFKTLDAPTRRLIIDEVVRPFQPGRIADSLAGLSMRDTFTGELSLVFQARPICDDLSGFGVTATRVAGNTYGKAYEFWSAVFYQKRTRVPNLSIEPDAVLDCSSDQASITMEVDDDYDPRGDHGVLFQKSRVVYDRASNTASSVKLVPQRLGAEQLIGLFTDDYHYFQIAMVGSRPTVVQVTDLHGERLPLTGSTWDESSGELGWKFREQISYYYHGKSNAVLEYKVNSRVGGLPAYHVQASMGSSEQRYLRPASDVLRRVDQPIYRALDFYYSKPEFTRDELRKDFFEEHELEPDPRDKTRNAVCRKIDAKFVGFLDQGRFRPTEDIGPIPPGFDPKQCRMCMGDEQSRRQTCGFGQFEM